MTRRPLLAAALLALAAVAADRPPLHERIDQLVPAGRADFDKVAAPVASDAEFVRRVYLDLTGVVPSAETARAFLKDTSPDKRRALIDRLLASPEHARHLAYVLDVMLMERRPDKNVPRAQWLEYLRTSVAENKPWDTLVNEILSSDGVDPKTRPAAKFFLDRDGEPNLITRDISRLFLGTNYQCCQCHDHPVVDDYKQEHYYGLFAFVSRSAAMPDPALKLTVLAEKGDGEVTFQSVFDKAKLTKTTGPRLPNGAALKEPLIEKGKEYVVAPAKGVRHIPTYSRRARLGPELTAATDTQFARNAANRLWALMMGRGLVHPLDLDHRHNPPSHPELLAVLTEEFVALKFDMRAFLRELALSRTYQRSSEGPAGVQDVPLYGVALLKPLSPEQLAWSLLQATGYTDAERKALGAAATEAALYARMSGQAAPVMAAFANQPGTPATFDARVEQALFLTNGPLLRTWLAPRAGNLTDRLALLQSDAIADELYLSVFTRPATAEERKDVADFLAARRDDRAKALQEMVWALLASAEFRFNH
jgi:hypothetical protein